MPLSVGESVRATRKLKLTVELVGGRIGRHCRERSTSYGDGQLQQLKRETLGMDDRLGRTENLGLRTLRKTGEKRERFPSMKG